jgi:hypothetical protein
MVVAVLALTGCSGGDTASEPTSAQVPSSGGEGPTAPPARSDDALSTPTVATEPGTGPPMPPESEPTLEPVPEIGVPGLDSDDRFCAAWSRFGGTWQVLTVGAAFLDDPPTVARWEAASSQVVLDAYDDLVANFPSELAEERDLVVREYFGVLRQRIETARLALERAGVDAADVARLGEAWIAALSVRDQFDADIRLQLPPDLEPLVTEAAGSVLAQRGPFNQDPTMVVTAATPATDDYLAVACPDRGALAGQEVVDGGDDAGGADSNAGG